MNRELPMLLVLALVVGAGLWIWWKWKQSAGTLLNAPANQTFTPGGRWRATDSLQ